MALVILLAVAIMGGCGKKNPLGRRAISGTITLNGEPLDDGSIQFSPHQRSSVASGGIIKNGRYRLPANKGLPPGVYLVRVFSPVEVAQPTQEVTVPGPASSPANGPMQPPPGEERIPPEYNLESTQTIEVSSDGDNVFNFDIQG